MKQHVVGVYLGDGGQDDGDASHSAVTQRVVFLSIRMWKDAPEMAVMSQLEQQAGTGV